MKKIIAALITCCLFFGSGTTTALAETTDTTENLTNAKGAILIEADTNKVLYEKNADAKLPMASTTKVMTAILAIENLDLDTIVAVDERASGIEGSSMYLGVGEKISVRNLLYGLMLRSGNDAAIELAILVSGSTEEFAELMNKKAVEIGALDTNFANPNGLPVDNHYTTAHDLALIASYAMQNETFREVVSTQYIKMPWDGNTYDRVLQNKNKILWKYEGGNGIKTGYTDEAGRCLVSAAYRDGMQLICVVLNCPDMFTDSMNMLDYGFENYERFKVLSSGEELGEVKVNEGTSSIFKATAPYDIMVTIKKCDEENVKTNITIPQTVDAPITDGQTIGSIEVTLGNDVLTTSDILYNGPDIIKTDYQYYLNGILSKYFNGLD